MAASKRHKAGLPVSHVDDLSLIHADWLLPTSPKATFAPSLIANFPAARDQHLKLRRLTTRRPLLTAAAVEIPVAPAASAAFLPAVGAIHEVSL